MPKVKLIIGLGNPGDEYEKTYHNVGFLYLDYLKRNIPQISWQRSGKDFEYFELGDFILVKPLTFMNDSGVAVKAAFKYFRTGEKIKAQEILIIHDDSDIELGKYKLSFGRGAAGHRGVLSIIGALKTNQFNRLRIGVRKKNSKKKAVDLVLRKITPADWRLLRKTFSAINDLVRI